MRQPIFFSIAMTLPHHVKLMVTASPPQAPPRARGWTLSSEELFIFGALLLLPLAMCIAALLLSMLIIQLSAIIIFVIFAHPVSSLDCLNQTCGNITDIRYPFSLTSQPNCPSFSPFFKLECNISSGTLHPLNDTLQVLEIHGDSLIVDISSFLAVLTTNQSNQSSCGNALGSSYVELAPFPAPYFIAGDNKFGSFGCTTGVLYTANLEGSSLQNFNFSDFEIGGCSVLFPNDKNNPECGYQNCCTVSSIASSRYTLYYAQASIYDNGPRCNSPCSSNYATLFHPNYTDFENGSYGLKLKWALPSNLTANEINQTSDYACSKRANFTIVQEVPGYLCSCNPGYNGDGYSNGSGCSDLDECKDPSKNDCIPGSTECHNLEGSYTCKCTSWLYEGDGHTNGYGCRFSPRMRNAFIITGVILVLALLMGSTVFLVIWWRKRKKRKYFMLNGGLQLQAYIARRGRETTRLFIAEELKAATNNYSDEMKLGVGGFGTVFKGILENGRVVAIKKANRGSDVDNDQFLNEMAILMQINHKHIVRLLGCCVEMPTPELVYEYVSNGNVAENLESRTGVMGWEQRLKVARQTAEALAYLHAAASPPILHRDVKSANVLLDDNLDAKVADFGISRLVPDGVEHVSTAVQGTLGYLDPEYFQTLQLTDKSDVYSLGVMLVELITGQKPVDNHSREPCFANLALLFINYMKEGRVDELIDPRLENNLTLSSTSNATTWRTHSSIMAVATLAHSCLSLVGAERPSMSHVADELRHITQSLQHVDNDEHESLPLLSSKQKYADCEASAVLAQNAQYYVQSSSNSMSIEKLLLNAPTMPR